ncbi:MAG: hypothetical protein KJ066_24520, partial [Acidobacteria bacterium]|nr:hypothetical protein [Acidobacteriota bacterium]
MFARAARRPGTPAYEDYYRRHPERQAVDDRLRALPELLLPGGRHYDERTCRDAIHYFHAIDEIAINAKDVERWASEVRAIGDVTHAVRDGLLRHGALGVGFAPIDPSAVYSHKGRFDGDYGQSVELRHPAAVVFLVEMDFDAMQHAPRAEVIRESARQYWRAAVLARTLEASLEAAGFETKAQYDAHYDVIVTHEGDHDSGIAPAHWGL